MTEPRAQRTLVKSPPELWAEISDVDALARHLGEFGEIRITRLEPETTVAWEGDTARGTVELQASGWGTKVVLTAQPVGAEAPEPVAVEPEPVAVAPEPVAVAPEPADATVCNDVQPLDTSAHASEAVAEAVKVGFFARLFGRKPKPAPVAEPVAVEPEPEPVVVEPEPVEPEPEPVAEPVAVELEPVEPEPVAVAPAAEPALDPAAIEAVLTAVLDDLGSAHHRPFSR